MSNVVQLCVHLFGCGRVWKQPDTRDDLLPSACLFSVRYLVVDVPSGMTCLCCTCSCPGSHSVALTKAPCLCRSMALRPKMKTLQRLCAGERVAVHIRVAAGGPEQAPERPSARCAGPAHHSQHAAARDIDAAASRHRHPLVQQWRCDLAALVTYKVKSGVEGSACLAQLSVPLLPAPPSPLAPCLCPIDQKLMQATGCLSNGLQVSHHVLLTLRDRAGLAALVLELISFAAA